MRSSFKLFTWRGIAVGIHWSLFVIAALISWSLADTTLPNGAPGYSDGAYWLVGSVTAVAFLASIAAHELGHAIVAQRRGIAVKHIDLWLFGGVASLETQPSNWQAELAVGSAGPAVSLLLGGLGSGTAGVLAALTGPKILEQGFLWFGYTNLVLAGFNLLPGSPLDGGRVLSALRWRHHGDARRARNEAARAGVMVANGLVAVGIVSVFAGLLDSGLWLAFLGWFLGAAARRELAVDQARHVLAGLRIASVMTPNPVTVTPDITLGLLVSNVLPHLRGSTLPVVVDGRLWGLITPDHLRAIPPAQWWTTPVSRIATPASLVPTARPNEELLIVLDRMGSDTGKVVVTDDNNRVVGVVTSTDIARTVRNTAFRELAQHPDTPLNQR